MFQRLKQAADKLGSIKTYYKNLDTRLHQEKKNINKVNSMKQKTQQSQQQQSQFSCYNNLKEQSQSMSIFSYQVISGLYSEKVTKLYEQQKKKITENIDQTISISKLQKYNDWIFNKLGSSIKQQTQRGSSEQSKAQQTSSSTNQQKQQQQQQQSEQNHSQFDRIAYLKYKWNEFTSKNSPNFNEHYQNVKDKMNNTGGSYYRRFSDATANLKDSASRKTRNAKDKLNDTLHYHLSIGKRISKYTLKLIFGGIFIFGFAYSTPQAISHYLTEKHKHEQGQQDRDRREALIREYQNKPN